MDVRRCLPADVPQAWPTVAPWLKKASVRYSARRSLDDDHAALLDDKQHLWLVLDGAKIIAAVTTLFHEQPLMRVCAMRLVGGSRLMEWRALAVQTIRQFAKENGCRELEQMGPKGWRRLNPEFEHRGEWLVMEL